MLCNARHVVMYPMAIIRAMMMATDTMETMDAMVAVLIVGRVVKGLLGYIEAYLELP